MLSSKWINIAYKARQERDLVDEIIIKNCSCDIDKRLVFCSFEAVNRAMIEFHDRKLKARKKVTR